MKPKNRDFPGKILKSSVVIVCGRTYFFLKMPQI
jgi:hypothetical protein